MVRTDYKIGDLSSEAQRHSRIFRVHRFIDAASVGFFSVVIILLLQQRGFGLFDISILLAVFSGTGLVLELPLGGLADGIGRKPVFMLSVVAFLLSILTLILFDGYWPTMLSLVFMGARMALMSGTLSAWFVEKFKRLAPEFSTQPVLAKNQFASACGLAISSVLSGVIADFFGLSLFDFGIGKYEFPLIFSFVLGIIVLFYTHFFIIETTHKFNKSAIKNGFSNLGAIVSDATEYGFRNRIISTMLIGASCTALAFYTFQSFWVPFTTPMLNENYITSIIGLLTFSFFAAQAIGSMLAKPAIKVFGGNMARALAWLTFFASCALFSISFSGHIIFFAIFLIVLTVFVGATNSPYASLFHDNIPDDKRSTLLSLISLMERLGGLVGLMLIGYIAEQFSIATAFKVGAIFMFGGALLYAGLRKNISNH